MRPIICAVAFLTVSISSTAAEPSRAKRIAHARELLGKFYKKSAAKRGERTQNVRGFVDRWTKQSLKGKWRKRAKEISSTIVTESRRYDLDPLFILAVIQAESGFRPDAMGTSGEIGLMQLRPTTARWIAKKIQIPWKGKSTLKDPVTNVRLGAAYFAQLRKQFDFHGRLYLAAYNLGPRKTRNAVDKGVWPKDYPGRVMKRYLDLYSQWDETKRRNFGSSLPAPRRITASVVHTDSDSLSARACEAPKQEAQTAPSKALPDVEALVEAGERFDATIAESSAETDLSDPDFALGLPEFSETSPTVISSRGHRGSGPALE